MQWHNDMRLESSDARNGSFRTLRDAKRDGNGRYRQNAGSLDVMRA